MLDFNKLIPQIETVGPDAGGDESDGTAAAAEVLVHAQDNASMFQQKLTDSETLTFWPLAIPVESFGYMEQLVPFEAPHTVVAVDGSQIMPSQHEVYNCFLINIGQTVISYGQAWPVRMDSSPLLFHELDEIYPLIDRRRLHVDESYVSFERTLNELAHLRDLSLQAQQERALPVVAFVDGSLGIWALEKMSDTYQKYYLNRLIPILESLRNAGIPIVGYISHSRSSEVANALRVWKCPYAVSNCESLCGHLQEEEFPCSEIWPALDRNMWKTRLERHNRSAVIAAGSTKGLPMPDDHRRCFLYLNVGKEVARVEFPRWLAENKKLLRFALQVTLAQVAKGAGYPVCIAEAHNLAVVRSGDRARFFDLLAKHLVDLGVQRVRISPKESGKRRSIV